MYLVIISSAIPLPYLFKCFFMKFDRVLNNCHCLFLDNDHLEVSALYEPEFYVPSRDKIKKIGSSVQKKPNRFKAYYFEPNPNALRTKTKAKPTRIFLELM